jgi:hypothetical protein
MSVLEVTNVIIYKGCDFEQDFQLLDESNSPINLVGCNVVSKIKRHPTAKTFNTFQVVYVNRETGTIRLSMSNSTTGFLAEGRNYFDIFVIFSNSKIKPVVRGTVLVEETASSLFVDGKNIGELGEVNTENIQDGEVLMYNQNNQQLEFVNPDEVLNKAADDGLPENFLDDVQEEIDNTLDLDSGEY